MGNYPVKPSNSINNPIISTTSNGNLPDIVNKDVIEKLQDLTKIISTYKKDNTQSLVDEIIQYDNLVKDDDKRIKLPQNIINKIKTYHEKILKELKDNKKPQEAINDYFKDDLEKFRQSMIQEEGIKDNKEVQNGLNDVLNNIKRIRTSSSFFEYKYVQMNIFMVYFIQKVYILLEKYTDDVVKYMILQNKQRHDVMMDFMQKIINLLGSEKNVGFSVDDQKQFMDMIDRLSVGFEKSEKKLKDDLEDMKTGAVKKVALEVLKGDPTGTNINASKRSSPDISANKNHSYNGDQYGGMIRDLSILPQKFFDLTK